MKKPDIFWSDTDGSIPNYPKPKKESKPMIDREQIARFICTLNCSVNRWDDLDGSQQEGWMQEADRLLLFIRSLGYRLPPKQELIGDAPIIEPPFIPLTGAELIAQERERQMSKEGWTAEHDDQHTEGELALAAALYAAPIPLFAKKKTANGTAFEDPWPWFDTVEVTRYGDGLTTEVPAWDKRKKHKKFRRLVIAGALIAAEIDRLQRLAADQKAIEGVKDD